MYIAFNSRCKEKNLPLFEKAIELRSKLSKELGYKSHADFKTEVKIVKNAETALEFLNNLNNQFEPLYEKERKDLLKFARRYKKNKLKKRN